MSLPGFTAEASLGNSRRTYQGRYLYGTPSQGQSGLPASVLPNQLGGMENLDVEDELDLMDEMEAEDMELEEALEEGEEA